MSLSNTDFQKQVIEDDARTSIPLTQGLFAVVDAADYEWLRQWKWHAVRKGNGHYARRHLSWKTGQRGSVYMHRQIMEEPENLTVDHINRDPLDNRRTNLRLATPLQQAWNRSYSSANHSPGITFERSRNRWKAQIGINGKSINLGRFKSPEEAASAYEEASRNYRQVVIGA